MTKIITEDPFIDELIHGDRKVSASLGSGSSAYDGASTTSAELGMWAPPIMGADQELLPEKQIADARVRDIVRNDAYVANGIRIQQDGIVGEKFLLNSQPNYKVLGLDEVWAEEFQQEVEAKFTLWAESIENYPDVTRTGTLTDLIRLIVGIHAMTGESLTAIEWLPDTGRPFNTAFQLIDLDRLSNPNGEMDTRFLRRGVKRNRYGAPIGYYIREAASPYLYDGDFDWKYVPKYKRWGRLQMLHIYDQYRPDQSRGVSMLLSALKETKMGKRFRDVTLQNAVLNASFAASMESDLPPEVAIAQAGGDDRLAVNRYATEYLSAIAEYTGGARNMRIDGVKIPVFFPGTKLKMQPVGTPGGVGSKFEDSLLRYTAAALNVSYSEFSKNYAEANYGNIRAELASTERRMRVQKRQTADRAATHFYALWLEEALNRGEITSMPRNAPDFYQGLNKEAYIECSWIGASMGQIDELKETQAAVLRLNNGLSTREQEAARQGKDWRTMFRQLEREQKEAERLGLVFGADKNSKNMMNAANGTPSEEGAKPRSETKEESGDE